MRRILTIDDDRELSEMLIEFLTPEGFEADTSHTGEDGLRRALTETFHLVILDVMLPRRNGFEVLRNLRLQCKCPVIMLTSRGQEVDRVVELEIGSDDYLAKSFRARELPARIHAILRRSGPDEREMGQVAVGDVVQREELFDKLLRREDWLGDTERIKAVHNNGHVYAYTGPDAKELSRRATFS